MLGRMSGEESGSEASARGFSPTRWSLVHRALVAPDALNTWVGLYWYPLYSWARRQNLPPEEASDVVQDFLQRLCHQKLLEQVRAEKGRLRSWLLKAFSNHLRSEHRKKTRLRRGGGAPHLELDAVMAESIYLSDRSSLGISPDQAFDRALAMAVMDEAMGELARYFEERQRREWFEVMAPALEARCEDADYATMAVTLQMNPAALRQSVVRMRQRYRRLLLEVASRRLGIQDETRLGAELREMLGNSSVT